MSLSPLRTLVEVILLPFNDVHFLFHSDIINWYVLFHEEPLSLLSRVMSLETTCHQDFRPVPTQTGLYNHRRWLGAWDLKGRHWLYYLASDYKGVDQLRGYHAVDLRFVLCICKKQVFS